MIPFSLAHSVNALIRFNLDVVDASDVVFTAERALGRTVGASRRMGQGVVNATHCVARVTTVVTRTGSVGVMVP